MTKQIRIIPKRREVIDLEGFAEALLDVVASLDEKDRSRLRADGEQVLEELKGGRKRKRGSAA